MAKKYTAVVTNPPYMNKFDAKLKKYIADNFAEYKGDLFSVFMYHNFFFCTPDGYSAFMTPLVWMFIKTYEHLRNYILNFKHLSTLIQFEYSAFEEATVPICTFVLRNDNDINKSLCFRLSDFKGGMEVQKQKVLEALADKSCGYYYETDQTNFSKIPGSPIAYWVSANTLSTYENKLLEEFMDCKSGIMTGSDTYIKHWHEVSLRNIKFDCKTADDMGNYKWFPLNSGGEFRKWYGNNTKVVNLLNNGCEIKANVKNFRLRDSRYYFKEGITWGRITSSQIAFRNVMSGSLFGDAGPIGFVKENKLYILGLLNSKVVKGLLQVTNPTLNFQVHDIMEIPLDINKEQIEKVEYIVSENLTDSKQDWDSYETSWDFKRNPLL